MSQAMLMTWRNMLDRSASKVAIQWELIHGEGSTYNTPESLDRTDPGMLACLREKLRGRPPGSKSKKAQATAEGAGETSGTATPKRRRRAKKAST
jgi:hypothetical protein